MTSADRWAGLRGRRRLALALAAIVLAACAPAAPSPTALPKPTEAPRAAQPTAKPAVAASPAAKADTKATEKPAARAAESLKPAGPSVALKVGHTQTLNSGALYIAAEKGYFRQHGLEVELVAYPSINDAAPLLLTGELAAYGGGTGVALFNARLRGVHTKAVADKSHEEPGFPFKGLVVRRDLYDGGAIRKVADLKGKKIATLPLPSGMGYQLDLVLRTAGLTVDDVDYAAMGLPDALAALRNGAVDAAFLIEPMLSRAKELNAGEIILTMEQVKPGLQGGVVNFAERLLRERELGVRFMLAYVRGIRDYMDAWNGKDRAAIVDMLRKHSGVQDREVYDKAVWGALAPSGEVNAQSLLEEQQWYVDRKLVARALPLDELVDNEFARLASQQLGPYTPYKP